MQNRLSSMSSLTSKAVLVKESRLQKKIHLLDREGPQDPMVRLQSLSGGMAREGSQIGGN